MQRDESVAAGGEWKVALLVEDIATSTSLDVGLGKVISEEFVLATRRGCWNDMAVSHK